MVNEGIRYEMQASLSQEREQRNEELRYGLQEYHKKGKERRDVHSAALQRPARSSLRHT
jgi:hypothetical protein